MSGTTTSRAIPASWRFTCGAFDKPFEGSDYNRVTQAALQHVGEGAVTETELGDDGAPTAWRIVSKTGVRWRWSSTAISM